MMQDNELIDLFNQGLSWRDKVSAEEQASLIGSGQIASWLKEIELTAESIGIERTLKQIAFSCKTIEGWGIYQNAILSLFELTELYGLSCDFSELLKHVANMKPETWNQAKKEMTRLVIEHLKQQVEEGDVYLFRPSLIKTPDFVVHVPQMIEKRKYSIEQARPYMMKDNHVAMFDFLELPITLEVMMKMGVGGTTTIEMTQFVLKELVQLEIIESYDIIEMYDVRNETRSSRERYLMMYKDCRHHHQILLRGCAMCFDLDESIAKEGLEMIHTIGHAHCKEPLLHSLISKDDEILTQALKGLSILGEKETIQNIKGFLSHPSNNVVNVALVALGRLRAEECLDEIEEKINSSEEGINFAAMSALLLISTEEAENRFWDNFHRFGMFRLSPLARFIGEKRNKMSVLFMVNLLMLDITAFIHGKDIGLFNAIPKTRAEQEIGLFNVLVEKLRGLSKIGFKRLGDLGVPVLVELLKVFPETKNLIAIENKWKFSENEIMSMMSSRIKEYHRLSHIQKIPLPVIETIQCLGLTHSERAIPYLSQLCHSDNEEIALQALEALGEIDTPAIDVLLEIPEKTPKMRLRKISEIGTIAHPKAIEWLLKQIEDIDPVIRWTAGNFLVLRNDPALGDVLLRLARDENTGVRAGLAHTILRLGYESYPEIVELLSADDDKHVRNIFTKAQLISETEKHGDFWA